MGDHRRQAGPASELLVHMDGVEVTDRAGIAAICTRLTAPVVAAVILLILPPVQ